MTQNIHKVHGSCWLDDGTWKSAIQDQGSRIQYPTISWRQTNISLTWLMNCDHNKHGPPAGVCRRNRIITSIRHQTAIPYMAHCQLAIKHIRQSGLSPGTGNSWPEFGVYGRLIHRSTTVCLNDHPVKTQNLASQQEGLSGIRQSCTKKETNEWYRPWENEYWI